MAHAKPGNIFLSVVIPAYDEAQRIGVTLCRILDYLERQPYTSEVLVVSDGSRDRTTDVVRDVAAAHPSVFILDNIVNRGKGYSVRRGVLESRGQFVLFSDADLSTPIEEVEQLIKFLHDGYDVSIASRALPASNVRVHQALWRESMGLIFNRLVQRLVLPGIHDSQCGFKCFPREVAQQIFSRQKIERFAFDVEVLWLARKLGYQIAEVPVTWINDPSSSVQPLRDATKMLMDLFLIRLNDWRGTYGKMEKEVHPRRNLSSRTKLLNTRELAESD